MEEYIDQIEKFLRGKLSMEEEKAFKTLLTTDTSFRNCAFIVVCILKQQKPW